MDIIPALDVRNGRLARICPGEILDVDAFEGDPIAAAEAFILEGARWLHVVDLDLAFSGDQANLQTISLLAVMDARVQASGGIVTEGHISAALQAGAQRVVIGSAALGDRDLLRHLVARFGDAVAVAIEIEGDRIRPRGGDGVDLPLEETLDWLAASEVARVVHVAVDRVGELAGPDLEGVARAAFRTRKPIIASGGVATAADVRAIASLGPLVQGAILGRTLYEGGLRVREAIRAAAEADA